MEGGGKVEPLPPAGLATEAGGKIGVLQGIPHLKEVFNETDAKLRGSGKIDQIKNWVGAQTAGTKFQTIAMPVPMQQYFTEMRAILAPYVRSVSGLVFPERTGTLQAGMPIPGVTDPSVVDTQWDSLIQEMVRDIKAKYGTTGRQAPNLPTGEAPAANPVDSLLEQYKKEYGAPPSP
jgi:hypothetical protein